MSSRHALIIVKEKRQRAGKVTSFRRSGDYSELLTSNARKLNRPSWFGPVRPFASLCKHFFLAALLQDPRDYNSLIL